MKKIVTLTVNPTIDKSSRVDTVASEIKLRCDVPAFHPGGGGINVSRAIKKLGGESTAIYTAGGGSGQMLTHLLEQEHITTHPIPISDLTRENLTVYENSTGLQYRFGMPGPMVTEWQRCIDVTLAANADYIVASGSLAPAMPTDFYKQLADRVRATDSKLIVDTSGTALEACVDSDVFLLKPNLYELELLSGKKFESEDKMLGIVREMIAKGMAEVFVISMGAAGAMMITADQAVKMRPPVVPIQSKVGAGDSMVGGLVWSLSNGDDLITAVRYGISAGTAAVMTEGTELCRSDDVHDIFARIAIID
ncbi:MAG: 1-phosphofructokinase family hexose kinase [Phototrophicaceae bacterium]